MLKRFLQPDPSGIDGMRSYVYMDDGSVDGTDPSGLRGPIPCLGNVLSKYCNHRTGQYNPPPVSARVKGVLDILIGATIIAMGCLVSACAGGAVVTVVDEGTAVATTETTTASQDAADAADLPGVGPPTLWSRDVNFRGVRVYQRDDLVDPTRIVGGKSNLARMDVGNAPIGPDGKQVVLHHLIQTADSPLAEVESTLHSANTAILNINPDDWGSAINRSVLATFRYNYWKWRAQQFRTIH
jgi:hypothetical protein